MTHTFLPALTSASATLQPVQPPPITMVSNVFISLWSFFCIQIPSCCNAYPNDRHSWRAFIYTFFIRNGAVLIPFHSFFDTFHALYNTLTELDFNGSQSNLTNITNTEDGRDTFLQSGSHLPSDINLINYCTQQLNFLHQIAIYTLDSLLKYRNKAH